MQWNVYDSTFITGLAQQITTHQSVQKRRRGGGEGGGDPSRASRSPCFPKAACESNSRRNRDKSWHEKKRKRENNVSAPCGP